jgi:predicted type IV restriction endonuclease
MARQSTKQKLDKDTRRALAGARSMIENVAKTDGNEAETRRRVERIFESVMGYDIFRHITREYAVHGAGDTEHCDFAIQVDHGELSGPAMLVELKRVNIDLAPKHLKQVASYAIDLGCDWALLTNGREWKLYHISFGKPPQTKLIESWNLVEDEPATLAREFDIVSYKNVKKGGLDRLWEKSNVLTPQNIINVMLSEDAIRLMQRALRKATGVLVSPEDVVGAIRRLLNEAASAEMNSIKISLPEKRQRKKRIPANSQADKDKPPLQTTEEAPQDEVFGRVGEA